MRLYTKASKPAAPKTPEGKVKAKIKEILDTHNAWHFMPVAGPMSRIGVPDFICCINGHFLAIEAKARRGRATGLQLQQHIKIEEASGHCLIVSDDTTELEALCRKLAAR